MTKKSNGNDVKIRATKLGGGKVSTGVHVAVEGETMAQARDMLIVPWRTNWKRDAWRKCSEPRTVSVKWRRDQ